jgi:hypothetical protein
MPAARQHGVARAGGSFVEGQRNDWCLDLVKTQDN